MSVPSSKATLRVSPSTSGRYNNIICIRTLQRCFLEISAGVCKLRALSQAVFEMVAPACGCFQGTTLTISRVLCRAAPRIEARRPRGHRVLLGSREEWCAVLRRVKNYSMRWRRALTQTSTHTHFNNRPRWQKHKHLLSASRLLKLPLFL